MKTKCIFAAIALILAVGTAISNHNQTKKPIQSDLTIANIEALTYDEWGYDHGCLNNGDGCLLSYSRWYPDLLPKDM